MKSNNYQLSTIDYRYRHTHHEKEDKREGIVTSLGLFSLQLKNGSK
jgi:hypothetical protein